MMNDDGFEVLGTEPLRFKLDERATNSIPLQDALYKTLASADEATALAQIMTPEGPMIVLAVLCTIHDPDKAWKTIEQFAKNEFVIHYAQGIGDVESYTTSRPRESRDTN